MKKTLKVILGAVVVLLLLVGIFGGNKEASGDTEVAKEIQTEVAETIPEKEISEETEEVTEYETEAIDTEEEVSSTDDLYVIPGVTYEYYTEDDQHLFLNIYRDDSDIELDGFSYDNDGNLIDGSIVDEILPMTSDGVYSNDDYTLILVDELGYITFEDNTNSNLSFTGEYTMVNYETEESDTDDVVILTGNMAPAFFKNPENIGKEFQCELEVQAVNKYDNPEFQSYYYMVWDNEKEGYLSFCVNIQDWMPILTSGDKVTVTGIYKSNNTVNANFEIEAEAIN